MKTIVRVGSGKRMLNYRDKQTQQPRSITFQEAYLVGPNGFPQQFDLAVPRDGNAYAPGDYHFADDAIFLNRDKKLAVGTRLVPAVKAATGPIAAGLAK